MKVKTLSILFFSLILVSLNLACSSKTKTSILQRDPIAPPKIVQDTFAREGKSDYFLLNDEGYSFRLIYLCENRVYNFLEEPAGNPVIVSLQPILETSIENKLSFDDLRRIWACMERKVRDEYFRIEEIKRRTIEERLRLENDTKIALADRDRIISEIENKKRLEAERQRKLEGERRKAEEERLRQLEEEQRRKAERAEEERKIKAYKAGEKEKEEPPVPPPPPNVTESGIFLVMKETNMFEEARKKSKVLGKAQKYDILEVINSKGDKNGDYWYQFIFSERLISDKGKRVGWSPEDKSFWTKNKLLAWVYPGDPGKIGSVKPLKLNADDIQFTGKKATTPQKSTFYEVIYEVNTEYTEKIPGWLDGKDGIRRSDKSKDEMRDLLKELAKSLWPMAIQTDILSGHIRVGFTYEQVVASWGKPNHVNRTKTLVGIHEQWVYGQGPFPNAYVYFENGLVKNWEFLKKEVK